MTRLTVVTLMAALLSAAPLGAATAERVLLSYASGQQDTWTTSLKIWAKLPLFGERELTANYQIDRQRTAAGLTVVLDVAETVNPYYDRPIGPFRAELDFAGGSCTEVRSPVIDDDYQGTFVEDSRFLFLPMPERAVVPGDSWDWQSTLYLPSTEHLGAKGTVPRAIRVCGVSTFTGCDERGLALIDVRIKEESGKNIKLHLEGQLHFDPKRARIAAASLLGKMSARKLVFWFDAPLQLQMATDYVRERQTPATAQADGHQSLPGFAGLREGD